jgi:hypothetical protein
MPLRLLMSMLAVGCLLVSGPLRADRTFIDEPEPFTPKSVKPGRKWTEGEVRLPSWPNERDLVEIKTDSADARFTYYLDVDSLSTGDDGVVRYTVVAESASGARNLTFEGIRCTPRGAYKIYAYGANGKFMPADVAGEWQRIDPRGIDVFRTELWQHYLCVPRLFKPRPERDQIRMLRSGRVPAIENRGFLTN